MFSYSSYLEYLSKIIKKKYSNLDLENFQNNVVKICSPSKDEFWRNFSLKNISFKDYKRNCLKIKKNVLFSEPVQYLTQRCSFYGFNLSVSKGVFSPQPDTEMIIHIFNLISKRIWKYEATLNLLEIGTGTGAISIALSSVNNKKWSFVSTDINKKAIDIANKNSYFLGIRNVKFVNCSYFPSNSVTKFDVLLSNPPYISIEKYRKNSPIVKKQPKTSLVSKKRGTFSYYKIISESRHFLKKKFLVLLEIDNFVFEEVKSIITCFFPKDKMEFFKDLSGNWRVISYYNF